MSVVKTLLKVNVVTALVLLIGIGNNVAIAGFFGLTRQVDAYYAAIMLPALFMAIFVDFLGKNFLPAFSELKKNTDDSASNLASSTINIISSIVAVVSVFLCIYSLEIFTLILPGFSEPELLEVRKMFLIIAPAMVLISINTFTVYVCHYDGKFVQVALCKMMLPLGLLVSILIGHNSLGVFALPYGFIGGYVAMFILLQITANYKYRPIFDYNSHHIKRIFVNSSILVSFGTLARSKQLFEKYFGSMLDAGAISAITFASRICDPLENKAQAGVRSIAFAKGSKLNANDQLDELCELNTNAIISIYLLILPIISWLALNTDSIVNLLFGRGEFDKDMTDMVSLALIGLLPTVVIRGSNQIVSNIFYVTNMIMVPAIMGAAGTFLFIAFAVAFSENLGVLGLALSHSLSTLIIFLVFVIVLGRRLEQFSSVKILTRLLHYSLLSLAVFWVSNLLTEIYINNYIFRMGMALVLGAFLYVAFLATFKDSGFLYLKKKLLN